MKKKPVQEPEELKVKTTVSQKHDFSAYDEIFTYFKGV